MGWTANNWGKPKMKVVSNSEYAIIKSTKEKLKKDILLKEISVHDKDGNLLFKGVPTSEIIKLLK